MMLKRIEINVYTTFISFLVLAKVLNINLSSKKIHNVCRSYNFISYTLVIVSEVRKFFIWNQNLQNIQKSYFNPKWVCYFYSSVQNEFKKYYLSLIIKNS